MELDVSFSKDAFTKNEFNVDRFLQESCQKSGLHKLHKELGMYIKYLQAMIVDLVNNESNAIVNLSSDLKVLQNKFGNLSTPLGQLKEELMQIYKMIDTNLNSIKYLLAKRESIVNEKNWKMNELRMLMTNQKIGWILETQETESVPMETLERSVNQYIMQHMYSQLCPGHGYSFDNTYALQKSLSAAFLTSLQKQDAHTCVRCLQMYMLMNAQDLAHNLYRIEIIRPALHNIISESNLKVLGGDLTALYSRIISFIQKESSFILNIVKRNQELVNFDFLLDAVWPEISEQLKHQLSSVYAPGNPQVFQQRFQENCQFLAQMEQWFGDKSSKKRFRCSQAYVQQQALWNLNVYFEIRYLEIVQLVQDAINQPVIQHISEQPQKGFRILACEKCWDAMEQCFASDIFLPQLLDKFWKLTLQIISRLCVWISRTITSNLQLEGTQTSPEITESQKNDLKLKFLSYLHADIMNFIKRLNSDLSFTQNHIPDALKEKIRASLDEFKKPEGTFPVQLRNIEDIVIEELYKECSVHVKSVSQIPRLYRKTNRTAPTAASPYVRSMTGALEEYTSKHGRLLDADSLQRVSHNVHSRVTQEYSTLVAAVLTSVAKTEESLRRLKKTRVSSGTGANTEPPTESADDQKIRAQLYIDITSYCQVAEQFVNVSRLRSLANDAATAKQET